MKAELPPDELDRLRALESYHILDTLPEQAFDDLTLLASQLCGTPMSLVSFIDEKRQWFKSRRGFGLSETSRDESFCAHAMHEPDRLLMVSDAREDGRFADNPLVTGKHQIRFYAGAPMVTASGEMLGTLCVLDNRPRTLSDEQQAALQALSRQVMAQLELRRSLLELEKYQEALRTGLAHARQQSLTDGLTGLNNRRAFDARLQAEFDRARRYVLPLSLLMMDIDHFKAFNDSFGHIAGDELLQQFGRLLKEKARSSDIVARYGGEEFAIILPNTNAQGALMLAERFCRAVEAAPWARRPITVSIGVASFAPELPNGIALLQAADRSLYKAKQNGRNRVVQAMER